VAHHAEQAVDVQFGVPRSMSSVRGETMVFQWTET
jgi:hypothetical protein